MTGGVQGSQWPPTNADFEFFFEGIRTRRLLVQQCSLCQKLRFPPGPMCPRCNSLQWKAHCCSGLGTIHSFTVMYRPVMAPFTAPHTVVLVALEEGVRVAGVFTGINLRIGLPVSIHYIEGENGVLYPGFREES